MLENAESILRDQCGLAKDKPVLVGVSGGQDSLCLLGVLRDAGYPVIVAHFNHKLRPEAEADAQAVQELAAQLDILFAVEAADVRLYAAEKKLSIEEAARALRYQFLFAQARRHHAQAVAVGHTADDQVETVLMHFIRGAGLNGLKGMSYRAVLPMFDEEIPLVRPLLDAWRDETAAYCAAHGLNPHYDPSNDSPDFLRNRLRHELIPLLETYNPRFREAARRTSQTISSDFTLLAEAIDSLWSKSLIHAASEYAALDLSLLIRYSAGLQGHLIRRACERLAPGQEITYEVLERATAFIAGSGGTRQDLTSGLTLFREDGVLYIATSQAELPLVDSPQMPAHQDSIPISIPGHAALSENWEFASERQQVSKSLVEESSHNEDGFRVWLDADSLPGQLELRVRCSGDRFEPLGLNGHSQKLSDFFTNVKMPRRARARWPLLSGEDKVIWVPGYRPAHSCRLTENSRNAVCFTLSRHD